MVLFFPNTLTNEGPEAPEGNIKDLPFGNVRFEGNVYKEGPMSFFIDNELVQTLSSDGITIEVPKNITDDFKVTGNILLSTESSKGKLILTDTFTNTANAIEYNSSDGGNKILLSTSKFNINAFNTDLDGNLTTTGKVAVNDTITNMDSRESLRCKGRLHVGSAGSSDSSSVIQMQKHSDSTPKGFIFYGEDNRFRIRNSASGSDKDFTFDSAGLLTVPSFTVENTTNPTLTLKEDTTEQLTIYHNSTTNANYINSKNTHPIILDINGTEIARVNTSGIETNNNNSVKSGQLIVKSATGNNGVFSDGTSGSRTDLNFFTNNLLRMIVEKDGKVTIGDNTQSNSGEQLTVVGSIKCNNVYTTDGVVDDGLVTLGNNRHIKIDGNTTMTVNEDSFKYSDNHHVDILNTANIDSDIEIDFLMTNGVTTINVYINDAVVDTSVNDTYTYTHKKRSKASFWFVKTGTVIDIYIHTMN